MVPAPRAALGSEAGQPVARAGAGVRTLLSTAPGAGAGAGAGSAAGGAAAGAGVGATAGGGGGAGSLRRLHATTPDALAIERNSNTGNFIAGLL
ncbi:MAG: hypothetical protein EPO40_11665 [Myxococcaceae bacterium]|nr:MAG: hypothetical protein EPO40_11665 [Myxococcaceae bacterium]